MDYRVRVPPHLRGVSESIKAILFELRDTTLFKNEETTLDHGRAARRCLPSDKTIADTGILVDVLLVSMMGCAVDEAAKRYTACAILKAQSKGLLLELAEIWFYYLLLGVVLAAARSQPVKESSFSADSNPKSLLRLADRGDKFAFRELATTLVRHNRFHVLMLSSSRSHFGKIVAAL